METKQFKTESKKLLDLMINSIYTHKEIFLRELISNANDAMDKRYFKSLTDHAGDLAREDYGITLAVDNDARTLTITDTGIGMTQEDLEENLGTIAHSGSLAFKTENKLEDDMDVIGQFGVGFYSAFMVSDEITVITKALGSDDAYEWKSTGADGYTITKTQKDSVGSIIILSIKPNTEEENYDEYLQTNRLQAIVKRYSDYIRYPIKMDVQTNRLKDGTGTPDIDPEYESIVENKTLNSMVPLWRKQKSEITAAEYNEFYKDHFHDFADPAQVIHSKTEGAVTYSALLYIPSAAPYNYYSKEFEKGLQLYTSNVMIMDKCADLLPDHFSFVRGLVDSEDLSLNISRELLQHDRQLKLIAKSLEKKIKSELLKLQKTDRDQYKEFFKAFGLTLKFGIYNQYGMFKEDLKDLIMFHSSMENTMVTLADYVGRMKEDQKSIYYACGESINRINSLPQTETVKDKGYEILYFTDEVDEFAIRILAEYDGKPFQSISAGDLDLDTEEEKTKAKEKTEQTKTLFETMTATLKDKVTSVRLTTRLKSHAVCLTTDGEISLEMEKVLNQQLQGEQGIKAQRVLEINANHPVFDKLQTLEQTDSDKLARYTNLLYTQACLIEGLEIDDPVAFSNDICSLMAE